MGLLDRLNDAGFLAALDRRRRVIDRIATATYSTPQAARLWLEMWECEGLADGRAPEGHTIH